ncbi:MAG: beta-lactamase family protein [Bacteroidetes bacterium]|nr:beta-lactamase family protein [Bacteroidota bacterium]MBU1116306.1 beta-lactamase family protein [Bacteroidota bacterium]MBU1799299.1 beta-lactamase family protein [Bacteroidota bacterium]
MKNLSKYRMILLTGLLLLNFISCSEDNITNSKITVNNEKLEAAFGEAQQIENLKSFVIYHNGKIIKEAFFNEGGSDVPHDVRSVTKSVISLLVGIAIDKGFIQSAEQPIGDYLRPIYSDISIEKANIKISHLLTMSSGIEWYELGGIGYNDWITSSNQVQFVLDKPLSAQPGQIFNYNSGALHLLSVIISQASEMSTMDFARKYLFAPLDIGKRNWSTDKQGYNNGSAGLQITPYDMVKIGQLILNGGEYNGKKIVSPEWIKQIRTSKISTNTSMPFANGYSYCWWRGQNSKGNYSFANGYGGQFIVVVPNLELIVVATNKWSGVSSTTANEQWYRTMDLIITKILAAFH